MLAQNKPKDTRYKDKWWKVKILKYQERTSNIMPGDEFLVRASDLSEGWTNEEEKSLNEQVTVRRNKV